MGKQTGISWTDHTFNPWWGCTKVSPGCDHCYAEAFDKRVGGAHWGKGQPRRKFTQKHWDEPLAWNRDAEKAGKRALVFCASMADVMDDEAPGGERERLWRLIDSTPNLVWQLLTKRPQRYERYLPTKFAHGNVWLGITAENQEQYDLRYPHLLTASLLRNDIEHVFVSYEPAIGPLDFTGVGDGCYPDWIIAGGESGAPRRTAQQEWFNSLRDLCAAFDVAFFMKQMGARTPAEGKALIPADLLIQQFPGGPGE